MGSNDSINVGQQTHHNSRGRSSGTGPLQRKGRTDGGDAMSAKATRWRSIANMAPGEAGAPATAVSSLRGIGPPAVRVVARHEGVQAVLEVGTAVHALPVLWYTAAQLVAGGILAYYVLAIFDLAVRRGWLTDGSSGLGEGEGMGAGLSTAIERHEAEKGGGLLLGGLTPRQHTDKHRRHIAKAEKPLKPIPEQVVSVTAATGGRTSLTPRTARRRAERKERARRNIDSLI